MGHVPKSVFFTKGVGVHKDKLASFEQALRDGGIEKCNLVSVSSILPPGCDVISKEEALGMLKPGEITFCVMARKDTEENGKAISAAVGLARPEDKQGYGYLSEHCISDKTNKQAGDHAEDLAATMLATTQGIEFDPETAWNERKQIYQASGKIYKTQHICQSAEGTEGTWTTVVAAAVFLL